jgi:SAM-dependent methyltransferase
VRLASLSLSHEQAQRFAEVLAARVGDLALVDSGFGRDKLPGAVGVDPRPRPGVVDVVHDLNELPWPLEGQSFDLVSCNLLLEHVEGFTGMMAEFAPILRPGVYLVERTPHCSTWVPSTTRPTCTTRSLDAFVEGSAEVWLSSGALFDQKEVQLSFVSGLFSGIGRILAGLSMRKCEKYWCRSIPKTTLEFRLR